MYAVRGGKIMTMDDEGILEDSVIYIEGSRITRIAPIDEPVDEKYELIDATGKYICPGFIDAHTHIGLGEEIYRIEGDDINEISDPFTPYLQALDGVNFWDLAFQDALKGGVTRAMCMPGSANIIGGQAVCLKTYAPSKGDMVYKNPWGLKAALGENPKRVYQMQKKAPRTRMANASILRQSFYTARQLMDSSDLKAQERYQYEPLFKVLKREMPLLLHVHRADDILTALRIQDEYHFDLIIQHGTEALLVADELVKRQVPVFLGPLFVNRAKVEMKEVAFENAGRLAQKGVRFCFISDHPVIPIGQLRVCAALAVRDGLDEETALAALTNIPASLLKLDDELGSIQVGKRADLLILNAHPFDFRSRVEKVFVDGVLWGGMHE